MNRKIVTASIILIVAVTLFAAAMQPQVSGASPMRPALSRLYTLSHYHPTTMGDLDGDGVAELIVMTDKFLIYDAATGEFEREMLLPEGASEWGGGLIAVGQLDGDPAGELVNANYRFILVLDGMTGETQWAGPDDGPPRFLDLYVGQMDGDLVDEIVALQGDGMAHILDGTAGAHQWSAPVPDGYTIHSGQLSVGDANGDGLSDLVITADGIWAAYTGPSFALAHHSEESQYGLAAIVNRDGTGGGEIVVARRGYDPILNENHILVDVFDGSTFQFIKRSFGNEETVNVFGRQIVTRIDAADPDGDGIEEFVLSGEFSRPDIHKDHTFIFVDDWNSPIPFPEMDWRALGTTPQNLIFTDIDGDPQQEVALNTGNGLSVFDVAAEAIPYFTNRVPVIQHDWPQPRLYTDDFSDPASGWPVLSSDILQTAYAEGNYHLRVLPGRTIVGVLAPAPFQSLDYELSVDVKSLTGPGTAYGVIFDWLDWDNYTFALLPVASDLNLGVFGFVNGEFITYKDISLFAGPSLEWNRLAVRRVQDEFVVTLNYAHHVPMTRPVNTRPVRVGLIAVSLGSDGGAFAFDHFSLQEIWRNGLPPADPTTRGTAFPFNTRPLERLIGR